MLVTLEALCAGRPVVAFSRGGLVDTLAHDVTGYLTDAVVRQVAQVINKQWIFFVESQPLGCRGERALSQARRHGCG